MDDAFDGDDLNELAEHGPEPGRGDILNSDVQSNSLASPSRGALVAHRVVPELLVKSVPL
jgi:hypothetical protein